MDWRNKKSNNEHTDRTKKGCHNKGNVFRKNQPENITFDFKFSTQQTESPGRKNQLENTNDKSYRRPWDKKQHSSKSFFNSDFIENGSRKENKFDFGYKRLEELCNKDMSEIIFVMSNKSNGFMDLFKQNKEPDWIFLLMKITAKICSSEFVQSKNALLTELTCNTFFDHLKTYILSTPTEKKPSRCNKMNEFFDDCLIVFQCITILFPKTAAERLKEIVISSNIALNGIISYCNNLKINENITSSMNELLQKLDDIKLSEELELKEKLVLDNVAQYFSPPENFRELSVYPTSTDLEYGEPFLRPNITKGAYHDVEHYLDVQFRLLREDFIAPLREGIQFYKKSRNNEQQNKRQKKINNIRIYCDVQFEEKGKFVNDKSGFLINFDKNRRLKIKWEMTKRFMYGSLLLFTLDDFRTFFLGVVLERKLELLKQGKLIVELLKDSKPIYGTSLTMVESEVFFEPYKCSMEVLRTVNIHNFPMEKYIVSACKIIDYPLYIETLKDQCYFIDNLYRVDVLSDNWPTTEELKLDVMQHAAFKAALTHEFTLIQGPPGTGKTFLGLKIMKAIIKNLYQNENSYSYIQSLNHIKPIIVVCYTNHALDQFMEGILNFTKQVVRIGGQSKSETIEQYSLKYITRLFRRSITTNIGLRNIKDRVRTIKDYIEHVRKCSEVLSYNEGIIDLSLLKNGIPKKYHKCFKTTLDLLCWLFQDMNFFSVDPIEFINTFCHGLINEVLYSEDLLEIKHEEYEVKVDDDDNDAHRRYELDDPDFKIDKIRDDIFYSITLDDVKLACKDLLSKRIQLEALSNNNLEFYNESEEAKFNFDVMEQVHDYFTYMLSLADADIDLPVSKNYNLKKLDMRQRWALYFSWVKATQDKLGLKILDLEQKYAHLYKQYSELRELENIDILKKMHVVALTTTGAAKHRIMLEGLESPIGM